MFAAGGDGLRPSFGESRAQVAFTTPPTRHTVGRGLVNRVMKSDFVSQPRLDETISDPDIHDELSRILESSMFIQSERLGGFLRFTVEATLSGKAETLKEYLIGTEVYHRPPSYHPGEDSIVRSEARRLRRKLKEYYESVGRDDPIYISYRPGSYIPVFRVQCSHSGNAATDAGASEFLVDRREVRVAVLPFVDASSGDLSRTFAEIITDELIHELVRTDGLRVTAATSVVPALGQFLDIPTLARKLDVHIILEGTVNEDNNRLRITCRVVNAADGFQIWSERFQMEPDPRGLFKSSETIVSALISRIRLDESLIRKEMATAGRSMLAAYTHVLAAEALLDEGSLAGTQAALTRFHELSEIDPGYARPVCGIAQCYCEMALRGMPDSATAISRAKEAAHRAAELAPEMILVPASMGCALALSWEWSAAENNFQQALTLGQHRGTYRQYALFLAALGRFDEAWNYLQKAQQIDPFSYRQKVVYTKLLHLSRNYDQAAKNISEQLVYGPLPIESEIYQAMMLISLDRRDEAKHLAQSLQYKAGAQPALMSAVAEVLAMCGQTSAASRIAGEYSIFSANSPISKFRQALLALALGTSENAIALLYAAYEEREAELVWLAHDPRLDVIRDDPRFMTLLNEVMPKSSL